VFGVGKGDERVEFFLGKRDRKSNWPRRVCHRIYFWRTFSQGFVSSIARSDNGGGVCSIEDRGDNEKQNGLPFVTLSSAIPVLAISSSFADVRSNRPDATLQWRTCVPR